MNRVFLSCWSNLHVHDIRRTGRRLDLADINDLMAHYDSAMDTEHGSGDHWRLTSVLDRDGFRTHSPVRATEMAEEIIT